MTSSKTEAKNTNCNSFENSSFHIQICCTSDDEEFDQEWLEHQISLNDSARQQKSLKSFLKLIKKSKGNSQKQWCFVYETIVLIENLVGRVLHK